MSETDVAVPAPAPLVAEPAITTRKLRYDGQAGEIAGIALTNGLLTLATLGIYRFWGRTRLRRYYWGRIAFDEDRLEYTGRGLELFIGFLVALVILFLIFGSFAALEAVSVYTSPSLGPLYAVIQLVPLLAIVLLIQVAIYRARRYRLSRTQWRGIRLGQTGSSFRYALLSLGWLFVSLLTFGLAANVHSARTQAFRTNHTWFGDQRLEFRGNAGDLFAPWFLAWFLWPFTLGISMIWYRVKEFRYFTASTRLGALEFRSELHTGRLLLLFLLFYLAMMAIFGLAAAAIYFLVPSFWQAYSDMSRGVPGAAQEVFTAAHWLVLVIVVAVSVVMGVVQHVFLIHPFIRTVAQTTTVVGQEDFARIAQSRQAAPGRGEGLADALDVGAI